MKWSIDVMSLLPPHGLPTLMLKLVWLGYRRFSGSCHAYLSTRMRWKSILCIALARLGYLPSPKVVKLPFSSLMVRSTILSPIGLASYRLRLYIRNCLLAALRSFTLLTRGRSCLLEYQSPLLLFASPLVVDFVPSLILSINCSSLGPFLPGSFPLSRLRSLGSNSLYRFNSLPPFFFSPVTVNYVILAFGWWPSKILPPLRSLGRLRFSTASTPSLLLQETSRTWSAYVDQRRGTTFEKLSLSTIAKLI